MKKIKLTTMLWMLFAAIILIEGFTLHRSMFGPLDATPQTLQESEPEVSIDRAELSALAAWLEAREGGLPAVGTPNPFAEYK